MQHDMVIANQGFPAFRADLNDALSALVSNNSGVSAPATTYANQIWYDTTNNILKIRNEDNDAWISLLTLNQATDALDSVFGLVIGTNVLAYDANLQSFVTVFTLPTVDGSSGQVLKTNGSGVLSFVDAGGSTISAGNSLIQVVDTGTGYATVNIDGSEVARFHSGGNLSFNSGYGSSAVAYGCRAWVNFNGTGTVAIRGSGNVSSITDNGVGDYTVNFTNAMPDTNYSTVTTSDGNLGANATISAGLYSGGTYSTTAVRILVFLSGTGGFDRSAVCVSVFR